MNKPPQTHTPKPAVKIYQADFVTSAPSLDKAPVTDPPLPEYALVGRSNVGKSSLINALLQRKNLAQTSNTPGKTRLLNYYRVTAQSTVEAAPADVPGEKREMFFVDLPGYGYAKVSKTEKAKWGQQMERFLSKRESIRLVIQCIDARIGATEDDRMMMEWLTHIGRPHILIMTKADKATVRERELKLKDILTDFPAERFHNNTAPLFFSAKTGLGVPLVWKLLFDVIDGPSPIGN